MKNLFLAIITTFALSSCAAMVVSRLPAADKARWDRCKNMVALTACGTTNEGSFCVMHVADGYTKTPPVYRPHYLLQHGCPAAVLGVK